MSEKEQCKVVYFEHPPGITSGCAKCRKVLRQGTWTTGIIVGEHRYLLGAQPPVECCGEQKKVIVAFDTEAEAAQLAERTIAHINAEGSTAGLTLYETAIVISEKKH